MEKNCVTRNNLPDLKGKCQSELNKSTITDHATQNNHIIDSTIGGQAQKGQGASCY